LPIAAYAEKGAGIQNQFDVNTGTLKQGVIVYISAFAAHVRGFVNADYGEDLNSADKQWDAGADILYVPRPENKLGFYMEIGGNSQWLDAQTGIENYARAAIGFGGVYEFGPQDALYLGYRGKAKEKDQMTHEIVARLIFGFE